MNRLSTVFYYTSRILIIPYYVSCVQLSNHIQVFSAWICMPVTHLNTHLVQASLGIFHNCRRSTMCCDSVQRVIIEIVGTSAIHINTWRNSDNLFGIESTPFRQYQRPFKLTDVPIYQFDRVLLKTRAN